MIRKTSILTALLGLTFLAAPVRASEPAEPGPWKLTANVGLNLAQSSYSSNWHGGDTGSFVWVLTGDLAADRQFSRRFHLANQLKLAYGQTSQQERDPDDPDETVWGRAEKSTDLVLFESVGRFTLGGFVDPYLSFRLDSQFRDQSDPRGSLAFNPVQLTEAVGIARVLRETEDRKAITRLGLALRQNIARTFVDEAGEETESFTTNDGGLEWTTDVTWPLLQKRVAYIGKLTVFLPVFYSQSGDLEDYDALVRQVDPDREEVQDFWRAPDVDFQNTFSARITEILSVNLFLHFVYDKFDAATNVDTSLDRDLLIREVEGGIRKKGQFKQTLAIGLTYRLF